MKAKNCKSKVANTDFSWKQMLKKAGLYRSTDYCDSSLVFIVDEHENIMVYDEEREEFGEERPSNWDADTFVLSTTKLCIELEN